MKMELIEETCSKCGKKFSIQYEQNSDYNDYCGRCLKVVMEEQIEDEQ